MIIERRMAEWLMQYVSWNTLKVENNEFQLFKIALCMQYICYSAIAVYALGLHAAEVSLMQLFAIDKLC
jgi:hypothetical protein